MGRTVQWMIDKIDKLDDASELYYKTFNDLYYNHKRPTPEMCSILNITMERAKELIIESNAIEYAQRNDCQNRAFSSTIKTPNNEAVDFYEKIINRTNCKRFPLEDE